MRILGFDPSLTSSGYAYPAPTGILTGRIRPKNLRGVERLHHIARCFRELLQISEAEVVVYEGYAMGYGGKSNPGRVFDIGELGGVLRLIAFENGVSMLLVSPRTLKMFVTGDGGAEKDVISQRIREQWGDDIKQNDEADAYGLYRLGVAYTEARKRRGYSVKQQEALNKVSLIKGAKLL